MDVVALVLWAATALGGATMAGIWLAKGGPSQHRGGVSRIAPARLAAHAGLAATGLVLWVVHVATDEDLVGWVALAVLPLVATIGFLLFMTWLAGRGAVTAEPPAEQRFPVVVVGAHGAFAVATLVAVVAALTL